MAHCWPKANNLQCANILSIITLLSRPDRRQAIIWTNAWILLIGLLRTNFSEILIEIYKLKKMHLKMPSGKWRPSCLCLNVLIQGSRVGLWQHQTPCVYIVADPVLFSRFHIWIVLNLCSLTHQGHTFVCDYARQWLMQINACRLFGVKPLYLPMFLGWIIRNNFCKICIKIRQFWHKKMPLNMSAKWLPFWLVLNMLTKSHRPNGTDALSELGNLTN